MQITNNHKLITWSYMETNCNYCCLFFVVSREVQEIIYNKREILWNSKQNDKTLSSRETLLFCFFKPS